VLSGTATYYLVRYLAGDRRAAAVAAIGFAYCPFVFGAHAAHSVGVDGPGCPSLSSPFIASPIVRPSAAGAMLGAVVGAQALFCAYYAVFAC